LRNAEGFAKALKQSHFWTISEIASTIELVQMHKAMTCRGVSLPQVDEAVST
jgi:hypothetical protein